MCETDFYWLISVRIRPGISAFDNDGNHLTVSHTIGGWDKAALVGFPVWESSLDPTTVQRAFMRCISTHEPVDFESSAKCPRGVVHHFASTFFQLPKGTRVISCWMRPYDGGVLTPRERECLSLLAGSDDRPGMQQDEIAEYMGVSLSTVKECLSAARSKLNARTSTEAVAKAVRCGLI